MDYVKFGNTGMEVSDLSRYDELRKKPGAENGFVSWAGLRSRQAPCSPGLELGIQLL